MNMALWQKLVSNIITIFLFLIFLFIIWLCYHYFYFSKDFIIKRFLFSNKHLKKHYILYKVLIILISIIDIILLLLLIYSIFTNRKLLIIIILLLLSFLPSTFLYYLICYPTLFKRNIIPVYKDYRGQYYAIIDVIQNIALVIALSSGDLDNKFNVVNVKRCDKRFLVNLNTINSYEIYFSKNYL